jgi:predicted nucleic acid-binding protein
VPALVLDTDVLIHVQRGHPPAVAWLTALPVMPSVPGIVVMELVQSAQIKVQIRDALRLAAPLPVVWPSGVDCDRALNDFAAYHLSHGLGLLDALIGATVVGLGGTLVTYNLKHYRAVPGLVTAQPYSR